MKPNDSSYAQLHTITEHVNSANNFTAFSSNIILILCRHARLNLPSALFPYNLTKLCMNFSLPSIMHAP